MGLEDKAVLEICRESSFSTGRISKLNNFDALRFWAALAVLLSHSFPLSYGSNNGEPLWDMTKGQTTIGTLAVSIFFVMSGYLITQSMERSKTLLRFTCARILRIFPALIVVVCLLAFVLGPTVTALSAKSYFSSPQPYHFVLADLSMLKNYTGLPGVFTANPEPNAVDGSLWTLHFEVGCYLIIFVFGGARLLNKYTIFGAFLVAACFMLFFPGDEHSKLCTLFLGGGTLCYWRPPYNMGIASIFFLVIVVCLWLGVYDRVIGILLPYLVLFVALSPKMRMMDMAQLGDMSYGIYIYAFPVQQIVAMLSSKPTWWSNFLISTPIVIGFAFLSWHLIEKPALSFKDYTFFSKKGGPS